MKRWWPRRSTFAHFRALAVLMMLSSALTVAVVANAVHAVALKWRNIAQTTGLDEANVVLVQARDYGSAQTRDANRLRVIAALRRLAGVTEVASVGTMAFVNDAAMSVRSSSEDVASGVSVGVYRGSPGYVEALGVRVIAGESLTPSDFASSETYGAVLITRAVALRLFGTERSVGRVIHLDAGRSVVVKGVTQDVLRPRPSLQDAVDNAMVVFAPVEDAGATASFVIRARDPARLQDALRAPFDGDWSVERIARLGEVREAFFAHEVAVVQTLSFAVTVMLAVTFLGLGGLSTLAITQRRRSLGIMRALGATRLDVIALLMVENTLVMGVGAAAGACFALVIGQRLSAISGIAPIASGSIALVAACVIVLGWFSVLKPALRATFATPREAIERG